MNTKVTLLNFFILCMLFAIGTAILVSDVIYSSLAAVGAIVLGLICLKALGHRQQDERDLVKKSSLPEEEEIYS